MKSLITALLITVFSLTTSAPAKAIDVVTGNNYFPYTDERLPGGGFATILVKALFEKIGAEANVIFKPWNEGYAATKAGTYLGTFPYIWTQERDAELIYAVELFIVRPSLFTNFERATGITQLSDLQGKKLCVPKGWGIDSYLTPLTDSGQLTVNNTTNVVGCFQLLHDGVVDAISIDRRLGYAAANRIKESSWIKIRNLGSNPSPNYLVITRNNPNAEQWAARLNDAKAELDADGTTARLLQEYYDQYR